MIGNIKSCDNWDQLTGIVFKLLRACGTEMRQAAIAKIKLLFSESACHV